MNTKTAYCIFIFLVVIVAVLSCNTAAKPSKSLDITEPLILTDVAYGTDPLQKMDIALVANRTEQTPLVVLVHGGGWMGGDKKDADFMKDACFANGINVVNINYRMGTDIHYREMMTDIDNAVSHLLAHADEWNIRKSKFVFWGGSAGAHLSLLYAYNYDKRDVISLVITLGAPVKLDALDSMSGAKQSDIEGLLPIVTGKPWNSNPELLDAAYKEASPYYGKNLKPSFLVHGDKDNIVPKQQSVLMSNKLKENNVADTLAILPNGGHGGENTPKEVSERLNVAMYNWIMRYSK